MSKDNNSDKQKSRQEKLENYSNKLEKWMNPNRWFGHRKTKPSPDEVRFVGFNDRMFAGVLDTILSFMLLSPLFLGLTNYIYRNHNPQQIFEQLSVGAIDVTTVLASPETESIAYAWILSNMLQFAILGVIFVGFWIYSSATPGKWILRMRIVDKETGMHPTSKQFIFRFLGTFISPIAGVASIFFLFPTLGDALGLIAALIISSLGFLWIIWDKEKQGWHDKIANTVVVKVKHWQFKAPKTSEFPDSWFEEVNEDDENNEESEDKYGYDDKDKDST